MRILKEFVTLSLGTVFLLLLVEHARGASQVLGAFGNTAVGVYGTLQGRQVTFPGGVKVG